MATSSSATTYILNINSAYPVAGIDNDTQGFRDNFKNIKLALENTDEDLSNLKLNAVDTTNPVTDFNNNIIKRVQLENHSVTVYDVSSTIQTGDVDIDYKNGSYQVFSVSSGTHWFSVSNWPGSGKSGALTLSINTGSTLTTYINFNSSNVYNLGSNDFPVNITNQQNIIFHLWSDGEDGNLYVKQVNQSNTFTKPLVLASYSTTTLATLGTVANGSLVFVSGYNRPAYYSNGNWYLTTGTILTL